MELYDIRYTKSTGQSRRIGVDTEVCVKGDTDRRAEEAQRINKTGELPKGGAEVSTKTLHLREEVSESSSSGRRRDSTWR